MRHPLWIINSSLATLLFLSLGFIFFTRQELPKKKNSPKQSPGQAPIKKVEAISLSKIYENDLFDTVKQPIPELQQPEHLKEAPQPPAQTQIIIPTEPEQPLLPPLGLTLKGVMIISDDSNNIAMIADNSTSKQKNYKVGDMIQDAQIIKIFSNRVVLIRSNGQQESLFLTEKDMKSDPLLINEKERWIDVVYKMDDGVYKVDPEAFQQAIPNLSLLIDLFDITTVYKEGKSFGCRIGSINHSTLATSLGFENHDIITKVFNLPITTVNEKVEAYKAVAGLKKGDMFKIEILRNNKPVILIYKIDDLQDSLFKNIEKTSKLNTVVADKTGILEGPSPEELEQQKIALLKEKYQFAPTMQEIILEQKKAMMHEAQEKRLQDFSFSDEAQ